MQSNMPLVSVVVPCYNHQGYVEETIKSIVHQTYENIELIVIDDGSKDDSPEIIERLSMEYGFYYESQENMGLSATLNKMIKMAKGDYISIIASDDVCSSDKIEVLLDGITDLGSEYAVVCGNARFIDDQGNALCLEHNHHGFYNLIEFFTDGRDNFEINRQFGTYESLLYRNYIPTLSTLIKKEALIEVGLYDEELALEDWGMWLKLAKKYKFKYIDRVVASYRWHDSNITKVINKRISEDVVKILENEKTYCMENGIIHLWKHKYYGAITVLLRRKSYRGFVQAVLKDNAFMYIVYLLGKLIHRET